MTHKQNMKVISQAMEEEVKRTDALPYATVEDRRVAALAHYGKTRLAECYVVVVSERDVWREDNLWQSSDQAFALCHTLVKLLQNAYDEGRKRGRERG